MSTSTQQKRDGSNDTSSPLDGLSRHDIVLAVIPVAFLIGLVAAGVAGVPPQVALGAAGGVGVLALVDGLFLNPPRRPRVGSR